MRAKLLIGGLLASALIVPAFAQSPPSPPANQQPPAATPAPAPRAPANTAATAVKPAGDMWRSSKLVGLNVYNDQNEKVGDISEILIDKSGKVTGVIIGVGGFLGMGRHDVMVEMSKLKFVDEPVRTTATGNTTTTGTGTGAANRPAGAPQRDAAATRTNANKWYPDHAVFTGVNKDQLKAMPEFKFD